MMKKVKFVFAVYVLGSFFISCGEDAAPSLFDPNEQLDPTPIVTGFNPSNSTLSGVGEIIITGENFSTNPAEVQVFFNQVSATVVSATMNQLVVKSPVLVGDSIVVRVAVQGAENFSAPRLYQLIPAVADLGSIFEGDIAYGIASDSDGNVYVFIQARTNRIVKITPDGTTTDYSPSSFLRANSMKMGPGNVLYVAASGILRRIIAIDPGGTESTFVSFGRSIPEPRDLDFDAEGDIWLAAGERLYRVKPDKSWELVVSMPLRLNGVRVFSNYLYSVGEDIMSGEKKIWRSEIQPGGLGAEELVLDVASAPELGGARVIAITFAEDGNMLLATTNEEGIFVLNSDGGLGPLYPGLILPEIYAMTWSNGVLLYAVRQRPSSEVTGTYDFSQLYEINMGGSGAPYWGR